MSLVINENLPIKHRKMSQLQETNHSSSQFNRRKSRSLNSHQKQKTGKDEELTIQEKCNYKLSADHLTFLMQEIRLKELRTIESLRELQLYYNCFNMVMNILYQSSKIVLNHMFHQNLIDLKLDRLQVICLLIGELQESWTQAKAKKLTIMCNNIYELSRERRDFERRIEYVNRKICMNKVKQKHILNCFINAKLKQFWIPIANEAKNNQKYFLIQSMFVNQSQRLCFMDIYLFVNKCLCNKQFLNKIHEFCKMQEIDQDLSLSYTFQFLLIEEFTFLDDYSQQKDKTQPIHKKQDNCCIM